MDNTRVALENILRDVLGPEFQANEVPRWSSLNHMRIIVEIEKEFEISFKPKEVVAVSNFEKLVEIVKSKQSKKAETHE